MSVIASQITGVSIVFSTVCSDTDKKKHKSSASLIFVKGIDRWIPSQGANIAESVSIWWRLHDLSVDKKNEVQSQLILWLGSHD